MISQNDPTVGNSVPPTPLNTPAFVGPVPFEAADGTNTRDQPHKTLVLRSPPFSIYPNGMISFALIGGAHAGIDLDEVNADGLPEVSSSSGAIGVALRQVSNGAYLTFNARSESGSQAWETIILTSEDLAGVIEVGAQYTLDFIDSHSGGWGWAGLDDVIIRPGMAPETGGFIVSVGLEGGQIVVEYTGQLQQASQVEGPWLPVEGASSPFSEPISQEMQFFRAGP